MDNKVRGGNIDDSKFSAQLGIKLMSTVSPRVGCGPPYYPPVLSRLELFFMSLCTYNVNRYEDLSSDEIKELEKIDEAHITPVKAAQTKRDAKDILKMTVKKSACLL